MQKGALQWLGAHLLTKTSWTVCRQTLLVLCEPFSGALGCKPPVLSSILLWVCWAAPGDGLTAAFAPEARRALKSWFRAAGPDLGYTDLALVLLGSLEWLCLGFSMRQSKKQSFIILGSKGVELWSCHFSHQDSIAEGYFGKCFHFITGNFCFSCSLLPPFPQLRDRHTWTASFRSVSPEFIRARLKVSLFFKGALIKLLYTWVF